LNAFRPPTHEVQMMGLTRSVASPEDQAAADAKNAALAFAALGATLGAALGAAGGLAWGSGRSAVRAGLIGLVVGAAAPAAPSLVVLPLYNAYEQRHQEEASRDLTYPLLIHLGIWSAAGAAGGLALALGLGARGRVAGCVLGGLAGAALGAATYEFLGAAMFPAARTARFVSETWPTRLMARMLVSVLATAGAALGVAEPRVRRGPHAP
jgi:hypothetical protein